MFKKLFYWISSTIFLFTLLLLLRPETVFAATSGQVQFYITEADQDNLNMAVKSNDSGVYVVDQWIPFYTSNIASTMDPNTYYDFSLYPANNILFECQEYSTTYYNYYESTLKVTEAYCTGFNGDVFTGNIIGQTAVKPTFRGTSYYGSGTLRLTIYLHVQGTLIYHVTGNGASTVAIAKPWWTITDNTSWYCVFSKSSANDVVDQTLINNTKSKINTDNNQNAAAENNLLNQYTSLTDGSYSTTDTIDPDWTASDLQTNTSKFTFVSNLITSVWNNLGDFQILLTTGLIVSFCMFLLNVANSRKKGS